MLSYKEIRIWSINFTLIEQYIKLLLSESVTEDIIFFKKLAQTPEITFSAKFEKTKKDCSRKI